MLNKPFPFHILRQVYKSFCRVPIMYNFPHRFERLLIFPLRKRKIHIYVAVIVFLLLIRFSKKLRPSNFFLETFLQEPFTSSRFS